MAAKRRYKGAKVGIAGVAVVAVVIGSGYFASQSTNSTAVALTETSSSTSPSVATSSGPVGVTGSITGASVPTPAQTTRPVVPATAPRARKSRGS